MNGEEYINRADLLLREPSAAKISQSAPQIERKIVKEELQFLRINEETQEKIIETLKSIHGPEFRFDDASAYENVKSNLGKKFWIGQGSLVVKGGFNYSDSNNPEQELDRLKQFQQFRLESYGFHKTHCLEALNFCLGDVEASINLLYQKYFNLTNFVEMENNITLDELLEIRQDEKSSLESIYEKSFVEKVKNRVWVLNLSLEYLILIFHKKEPKILKHKIKKIDKCRNFVRGVACKYGSKCRFSHELEVQKDTTNSHLEDFKFELEVRFPENSKYPFEAPLIFLKTNAVLPPLVNLHICKKLHEEAKILALDGIPCVYSITELLKNEQEITEFLKQEIDFLKPHQSLFGPQNDTNKKIKASHFKKGATNRDTKRKIDMVEILNEDKKIVKSFSFKISNPDYAKMISKRKKLPAWNYSNDILNTLEKSQIVVISGETGCGKSTQIPQFILDDWMLNYSQNNSHIEIICTQPRRISAIGVAERVSEERVEKIGHTVGYQIRLESKMSASTRLTFCTTGILLRRLEIEPTLPNVTHVIVDEVHERSEESDFLLLILRDLLKIRPDLKVILMSATMNPQLFQNYFGDIPIIAIPGRTFPVDQYFLEDILEETEYILEEGSEYSRKIKQDKRKDVDFLEIELAESEVIANNVAPDNKKQDENLNLKQLAARYREYSTQVCKNLYLMDVEKINYELIEQTLKWIVFGNHNHSKTGTILIFLPGIAEITTLYDLLIENREFGKRSGKYLILPLHSSLTSEEQSAIFKKPKDKRKIILSTNIAETSVTIDDCVFVIDTGKMKEKHFDPNRNMESLETVWVTKANALQRKGRAGRVMTGVCIHLYTNHRYTHHMLQQPVPEIHRIPLEQLILNIKMLPNFDERDSKSVLGKQRYITTVSMLRDILFFLLGSFIEPPLPENIDMALNRLQSVGALDTNENLTALGHHLAALPVDVRIGKLILYGAIFSCVDSALTMAACLSFKSPFVSPFSKRQEANEKKQKFAAEYSDHITVLLAYNKWLSIHKKSKVAGRNFANENFLSLRTLETIADIKFQFLEYLVYIGFVSSDLIGKKRTGSDECLQITGPQFNKNGNNFRLMSSILCASLYPNVIKILTPLKSFIMSASGAIPREVESKDLRFATPKEIVFMHPSSINYKKSSFPSPYLVYQEKVRTSKIFFRDCSMVPVMSMVLFSGFDLDIKVNNGNSFISLENGWIMFQVEEHKIAEMIKMIRRELFDLLEEKINDPLLNLQNHESGNKVISTIINLISL